MITSLLDATKGSAQGRLIASLEGGYHAEGVADGVESVLRAMLQWEGECGLPPPAADADICDNQDTSSSGPSPPGDAQLSYTTIATTANHGAVPDTVDTVARVQQRLAPYWKCFSQSGPAAKLS